MENGFCDWWGTLEVSVWTQERNSSQDIMWGWFWEKGDVLGKLNK